MKQISDINELKAGDRIYLVVEDVVTHYEFLMKHPHKEEYVLLLDLLSMNANKFYIRNILNNPSWLIDCSILDILEVCYKYHTKELERLSMRILELQK